MKNLIIKQLTMIMIITLFGAPIKAASLINEAFLKNINTDGDETSCSITENRKIFVFARKLKGGDNSDIYFSENKKGKWTEATAFTELNSDSDDISPFISSDGKMILFSSNRPGSLKNSSSEKPSYDIYYSEKKTGKWVKPELLFGVVNTRDDELNPFITKDNNVIYFTRTSTNTNSKTTIIKVLNKDDSWEDVQTAEISKNNDADIYMYIQSSYRSGSYITGFKKDDLKNRKIFYSGDSTNNITELNFQNDPAKTPGDEISVSELSKNTIIISSNSAGIDGSYDFFIKKIDEKLINELPKTILLKIEPVNFTAEEEIKIKVMSFSTLEKNSLPVKTEFRSPDSSGMISIPADPGVRRVLILPGQSGIKPFSVEFLSKNQYHDATTIKIEPSEENEFTTRPVYFKFNSSDIQITDIPYLHELINQLRQNDNTTLYLDGYSDGVGSYKSNLDVSVRRAERVKQYIIEAGIKRDRILTKGSGYVKVKTSDTLQFNRRVEFSLIVQ